MTWVANEAFAAKYADATRQPVWAVEIAGQSTVYTSGPVSDATWTINKILQVTSLEPGKADVARGEYTLGALEFSLVDKDGLALALATSIALGTTRVTLWLGFVGLPQPSYEKVGVYTVERITVASPAAYEFSCIEPFPEMSRALFGSIGDGSTANINPEALPGAVRIYSDDALTGIPNGPALVYRGAGFQPEVVMITGHGYETDPDNGELIQCVDLATPLVNWAPQGANLSRCLQLVGNPVNLIVRLLVDNFATTGTIQTDFPLLTAAGTFATGDGFGIPIELLDVAAIKAERDASMASLVGELLIQSRIDDGRGFLNDMCHGLLGLVMSRDGLMRIRNAQVPSAYGVTAPEIGVANSTEWKSTRDYSQIGNVVTVEGDMVDGQTFPIATLTEDASVTAVGRREIVVRSPWIRTERNGVSVATNIAGRVIARTAQATETLDLAADLSLLAVTAGEIVTLSHPSMPDVATGAALALAPSEVESAVLDPGRLVISIIAHRYPYSRAGLIAPDAQVDYADATTPQRQTFAFLSEDTGFMPDGSPGYKWV